MIGNLKMSLTDNMYMLSGCELIDTENNSLQSQNMKFVGEWAKRTSHKLYILWSRLIFFTIDDIHIQMTYLSSLNHTLTQIYGTSIGFDICISIALRQDDINDRKPNI